MSSVSAEHDLLADPHALRLERAIRAHHEALAQQHRHEFALRAATAAPAEGQRPSVAELEDQSRLHHALDESVAVSRAASVAEAAQQVRQLAPLRRVPTSKIHMMMQSRAR